MSRLFSGTCGSPTDCNPVQPGGLNVDIVVLRGTYDILSVKLLGSEVAVAHDSVGTLSFQDDSTAMPCSPPPLLLLQGGDGQQLELDDARKAPSECAEEPEPVVSHVQEDVIEDPIQCSQDHDDLLDGVSDQQSEAGFAQSESPLPTESLPTFRLDFPRLRVLRSDSARRDLDSITFRSCLSNMRTRTYSF